MKKFFTAIIVLLSLVAVPTVFTSCDDDDVSVDEGKYKYEFKYVVSNDYFDLFDINVTVNQGAKTTDVNFVEPMSLAKEKGSVEAKATTVHSYTYDSNTKFSVEAKVTLKSNWKEIIAKKKECDFYIVYAIMDNGQPDTNTHEFCKSSDEITEDYLNQMGAFLKDKIDFVGSK